MIANRVDELRDLAREATGHDPAVNVRAFALTGGDYRVTLRLQLSAAVVVPSDEVPHKTQQELRAAYVRAANELIVHLTQHLIELGPT
jgi:hypothetical protein